MRSTGSKTSEMEPTGFQTDDTAKLVILRLFWIISVVAFCWIVFVGSLYFLPPPVAAHQATDQPNQFSVRVAAFVLIAHIVSTLLVQLTAPNAVIRSRLISNTMFGGLVVALFAAATLVSQVVPSTIYSFVKTGIAIAFLPSFVLANFLLCLVGGVFIYRLRNASVADLVEIYWGLGLSLMLGLAIAMITGIAGA